MLQIMLPRSMHECEQVLQQGTVARLPRASASSAPSASFIFQPPDSDATGELRSTASKPTLASVSSTCCRVGWLAAARA